MRIIGPKVEQGYWEEASLTAGKTIERNQITKYNPNVHVCSKKIDFSQYEERCSTKKQ